MKRNEEKLTLLNPARELWLRIREAVRESLAEIDVREYAIGGGSILSARWAHHRKSYDIDLTLGNDVHLYLLRSAGVSRFEERMKQLGGQVEEMPASRLFRVTFDKDSEEPKGLDLWAHELQLPGGERRADVEGESETVLSTPQILWGKIERGDDALARDVYDVVEARRRDPESLEIAANAHSRRWADLVALTWYERAADIAREARGRIDGISPEEEKELPQLAGKGTRAIRNAYYTALSITRQGRMLELETRTDRGPTRRQSAGQQEAARLLSSHGLLADRETRGPDMRKILAYAIEGCRKRRDSELLYSERDGQTTAWRTETAGMNLPAGNFKARPSRGTGQRDDTRRREDTDWKR